MRLLAVLMVALLPAASAAAVETVTFKHSGGEKTVAGKLVLEAEDGGLLLLGPDTQLYAIEPQHIIRRAGDDKPYEPLTRAALIKQLEEEFGPKFRIHATTRYVICYNTSRGYAEWCGSLFERLHVAFYDYWKDRGLPLDDPPAPLVAIVFRDHASYLEYSKRELGDAAESFRYGYYFLTGNRMVMYDLTGVEGAGLGEKQGQAAKVNAILSRPGAGGTVATIIHEGTHQLAFNSGLHQRLAEVPRWLSEGMAMYFEMPDLKSSRAWTKVGALNTPRLGEMRRYLAARPADSLATLIRSDERLTTAGSASAAYAESWALNYYLIRNHRDNYVKYLKLLAKREPLVPYPADERLKDFQDCFGEDIQRLDAAFVKYVQNIR